MTKLNTINPVYIVTAFLVLSMLVIGAVFRLSPAMPPFILIYSIFCGLVIYWIDAIERTNKE